MSISVNQVTLVGRLGNEPQKVGTTSIVKLSVATSESWKDKNTGERRERTQWHSVSVLAEPIGLFLLKYARKGDQVFVQGQLENRQYERDGATQRVTEIAVRPYVGTVQLQSRTKPQDREAEPVSANAPSENGSNVRSGRGAWDRSIEEPPF